MTFAAAQFVQFQNENLAFQGVGNAMQVSTPLQHFGSHA